MTAVVLKTACLALAKKLNDKEPVKALLNKYGSSKIEEIDATKYAEILEAVQNYGETTTPDDF